MNICENAGKGSGEKYKWKKILWNMKPWIWMMRI